MINKLIKTEEDYDLALSRIEDLMDAEANSPEAEELELLATLVELYEHEYDYKEIRQAIYKNHKESIIKDLNQDLVRENEQLKGEIQELYKSFPHYSTTSTW